MKHAAAWMTALAVITTSQTATAEGQIMTQDQQNVLAAVQAMTKDFQDNDIAGVMASYEGEATVLFEPGSPVSEPAELEQMFAGMAALRPVFGYAGHEVVVNGDIAVHIASWTMALDGGEVAQSGLSIAVLRRQPDGGWKMVIDNPHGARLLAQGE